VNEDQAKSCIKILNGSMWKGCKLRIEIAREFYLDKLCQERLSAVETISQLEMEEPSVRIDPLQLAVIVTPPLVTKDTIVLKHGAREYEISMKPTLYSPTMLGRDDGNISSLYQSTVSLVGDKGLRAVIPCGIKRVFDDDHNDDEANSHGNISYLAYETSQYNHKRDHHLEINDRVESLRIDANHHHDGKLDKELPPMKKTRSTGPIGGAVRRGFGSLLLSTEMHKANDISCCIDKTVDDVSKDRGAGARIDGGMSSDDDEPCVRQEDLDDGALKAERNRALSILNNMFNDNASADGNDDHDRNNIDKGIDDSSYHNPSSLLIDSQQNDIILSCKDGYANVDQLKSIFHREGGVWWGDDGTMKHAVRKGEITMDPMFLEAERRGIELRPHQAVDANTGVSDKLSIGGGDSKSMVFSFFAAEPIDNGDDDGCDSAHLNNSNHQQQQHGGGGDIDRLDANTSAVLHSNITNNVSRRDDETQQANTKPIVMHWTISEIVQMAKSFSRSKSIEQMTEDWKVEREKLKIDYKRKMRDVSYNTYLPTYLPASVEWMLCDYVLSYCV